MIWACTYHSAIIVSHSSGVHKRIISEFICTWKLVSCTSTIFSPAQLVLSCELFTTTIRGFSTTVSMSTFASNFYTGYRLYWLTDSLVTFLVVLHCLACSLVSNICACVRPCLQGVSQLLKQSDWAQIQDFKWYHNDDYIYWKVKR